MSELGSRPSGSKPLTQKQKCEYIIRPNLLDRIRGPGIFIIALAWAMIAASARQDASFLISSTEVFLLQLILLVWGMSAMIIHPTTFGIGPRGIDLTFGPFRMRKRLDWSQISWRQDTEQIVWLVWEDQWLRIDLKRYPFGSLLPHLLQSRAAHAPMPAGPFTMINASNRDNKDHISLQWTNDLLHDATGSICPSLPLSAQVSRSGMLALKQTDTTLKIHPNDPRRPFIESLPQVAQALSQVKTRQNWRSRALKARRPGGREE